ncbi:MAG: hypothetical protein ABSE47_17550 [Acidimicrobiales bacterium]
MSDVPTMNEGQGVLDPVTEQVAVVDGTAAQTGDALADLEPGFDINDEWPTRGPRRGLRLRVPTAILLALLIAVSCVWGGAALQRHESASSTSGLPSFLTSGSGGFRPPGASAGTGSPAAFGGGGAASGTVTVVAGNTLWVTTASGGLVKVVLGSSTSYTRDAKSTKAGLKPGDTVVVQGTKSKNGSVAASSVAATAAGVRSTAALGPTG